MIIYEDVLRAFQKDKVKYVLVGGLALNLQAGFRNTADLDILREKDKLDVSELKQIQKLKGSG